MSDSRQPNLTDLDRRELQSTIFACVAVAIMGIGSALLMYPVVFTHSATPDWSPRIAFFGFCGLCVLLTAYVWDSHATIRRLRKQMDLDRRQSTKARMEASEDLLKSLPKLNSFQDQLPMEYRRSAATDRQLSILVLTFKFRDNSTPDAEKASILGDAAKAVARKLRDEDSIYVLGPSCFGALLPGMEASGARNLASRIAEGLMGIAGSSGRFTHKIDVVNYPQNASSAHELFEAVTAHIPADRSMQDLPANALA